MIQSHSLEEALKTKTCHPVINLNDFDGIFWMDLTEANQSLINTNLIDTQTFNDLVFNQWLKGKVGVGGYGENRIIYRRSEHYQGTESRSIHLGVDLWAPAGTSVFAPLEGVVFGVADNQGFGNYGPTIILQHHLEHLTFYTLYGHLSEASISDKKTGQKVETGERLCEIGDFPVNGDWPPHLHFQVITDMLGNQSDFPGVAAPSEADKLLKICPDPNLILQLPT